MDRAKKRISERMKRARRVRKTVHGTAQRPRLCVRRTLKHINAQIVDDENNASIALVNSTSKEVLARIADMEKQNKTGVAALVGRMIADKAKQKGVTQVAFDRKGYKYHGRVRALAEGAREAGLQF
jgi:large subunit ribosomal protein L18